MRSHLTTVMVVGAAALLVSGCTPAPPATPATPATPLSPSAVSTSSSPSTTQRLMAEARQFAFRIRSVHCQVTGSSFAIAQGIVTNRHVASGSTSLQLSTWNGNDFDASVRSIDQAPGPDLALLDGGTTPAVLDTADVPTGTPVWAAGYPEGNELTLTSGIVIAYVDGGIYDVPGRVMELTNAIEPGNSGGPLLDGSGRVAGVVFARNTATKHGLAIPVTTLTKYLAATGADTSGICQA